MKKFIILLISASFLTISCNPEEQEDFQKKEEDCGCDDVDTTASN